MRCYKALNKQIFSFGKYKIIPIRNDDRFDIMKWRNEQIYHLRQKSILTSKMQDNYFKNVISPLFNQEFPAQILFSFMSELECIGYGGLVHINWKNKSAEISFIMRTDLELKSFEFYWTIYLSLIEKVAFNELSLHKINTYAYDLRPKLYPILENCGYEKEKEENSNLDSNGKLLKVIKHVKYNKFL